MRTDFTPVHLKQANEKLDEMLLSVDKKDEQYKEAESKKSLWERFLGLFKSNPFELPEDLYKQK